MKTPDALTESKLDLCSAAKETTKRYYIIDKTRVYKFGRLFNSITKEVAWYFIYKHELNTGPTAVASKKEEARKACEKAAKEEELKELLAEDPPSPAISKGKPNPAEAAEAEAEVPAGPSSETAAEVSVEEIEKASKNVDRFNSYADTEAVDDDTKQAVPNCKTNFRVGLYWFKSDMEIRDHGGEFAINKESWIAVMPMRSEVYLKVVNKQLRQFKLVLNFHDHGEPKTRVFSLECVDPDDTTDAWKTAVAKSNKEGLKSTLVTMDSYHLISSNPLDVQTQMMKDIKTVRESRAYSKFQKKMQLPLWRQLVRGGMKTELFFAGIRELINLATFGIAGFIVEGIYTMKMSYDYMRDSKRWDEIVKDTATVEANKQRAQMELEMVEEEHRKLKERMKERMSEYKRVRSKKEYKLFVKAKKTESKEMAEKIRKLKKAREHGNFYRTGLEGSVQTSEDAAERFSDNPTEMEGQMKNFLLDRLEPSFKERQVFKHFERGVPAFLFRTILYIIIRIVVTIFVGFLTSGMLILVTGFMSDILHELLCQLYEKIAEKFFEHAREKKQRKEEKKGLESFGYSFKDIRKLIAFLATPHKIPPPVRTALSDKDNTSQALASSWAAIRLKKLLGAQPEEDVLVGHMLSGKYSQQSSLSHLCHLFRISNRFYLQERKDTDATRKQMSFDPEFITELITEAEVYFGRSFPPEYIQELETRGVPHAEDDEAWAKLNIPHGVKTYLRSVVEERMKEELERKAEDDDDEGSGSSEEESELLDMFDG